MISQDVHRLFVGVILMRMRGVYDEKRCWGERKDQ